MVLSVTEFADKLPITSVSWQLKFQQETTGLGGGDVIAVDLAPARWEATVNMHSQYNEDAAYTQALIESLQGSIGQFYLYAPQLKYPRNYSGQNLSGVTLNSPSGVSASLSGLPSGFTVSVGDMLSFDYGSAPTRRAMHRVVSSTGSSIKVAPPFRPGASSGASVSLIKAAAKCIIEPNSFNPGTANAVITSGMSFKVLQVV